MLPKGSINLDVDFYQEEECCLESLSESLIGSVWACRTVDRTSSVEQAGDERDTGMHLKIRLLEESFVLPALALGLTHRERTDTLKISIATRSRVQASTRWQARTTPPWFHELPCGINYSLERSDGDEDINVFAGIEKTLGPVVSLVLSTTSGRTTATPKLSA